MLKQKLSARRRRYHVFMYTLLATAVVITALLVVSLIVCILWQGLPNLSWELLSQKPSFIDHKIGILPDIINTLYLLFATLIIVLPLSVGTAIYLTEYAGKSRIVAVIEYTTEILSGIPSIIYGLVGMLIFFKFLGMRTSLLTGSLTLVIMNMPTVIRTTQESLKTVPDSYREGAFGLGAGKWRVIRTVVLPGCVDGIVVGCILATGRIIGESAALLFTAGFAHAIHAFPFGIQQAGASLAVSLYVYAKENGEFEVAFAIAAILLILAIVIHIMAKISGFYLRRR